MGLGGPVWHASVRSLRLLPERELARMAGRVLDGVGDGRRGEWTHRLGAFHHLRRRLAAAEEATVGPVVDVRCTPEAVRRSGPLAELGLLALVPGEVLADELGFKP
jgi:hypothetical protein